MPDGPVRTATVLFCDLVGSTAQRAVLGDDAADRLTVSLDRLLRDSVASHRGSVVKGTGDGLMAVFESASDAVNAAVAVQQTSDRRNRSASELEQLVLRVGISAGDVHYVANDCHGTPVVESARLEAAAQAGSIYVSDLVRLLAGSRGGHTYEPVGRLELKGFPEPVEAFRVPWTRADDVAPPAASASTTEPYRIPLPSRLAVRPNAGMVGYEAEVEVMTDALKRVMAGGGREILLIAGEAGLGKTTIASATARVAFDHGACVLFGHCEEDLAAPYQLFAEALTHYVAHAPEHRLRLYVDAHGSELARLVPSLAHRITHLPPTTATDAETERFLLFAAVVGLLADASEHQPLVLVLDDLQWADTASLQLLNHVAAADATARILVVGTFRDNELAHAHGLRDTLGRLRRHAGVQRIDLDGLDDAGVVAMLQAMAGYSLTGTEVALAHAVYRETDGNPFFVNQVLRHLVETGAIHQDPTGRWVSEGSFEHITLPDSVREVIGGRVARLGEPAGRVLAIAAVIGRDFDLELLAEASSVPVDDVVDFLEAATAAALVHEPADAPGHYAFAHARIQHTLYEDLGATRRARAHRQVAEALEVLCAGRPRSRVGELARHWTSAIQPVDVSKAIEYSRQAGDEALLALAPADALRYYAQALDLMAEHEVSDPTLALDLAIGVGTSQRQVGDPAYRTTLIGAARDAVAIDDTPRLVAAGLANDRGFFSSLEDVDTEAVEILDEALRRLPADDPDRALVLAIYCREFSIGHPLADLEPLADEALAIADAAGSEAVRVRVLNNLAYPLLVPPTLEQSIARTTEALERATRLGDPVQHFLAAHWRARTALQGGDMDEMLRNIDIQRSLATRLDQPNLTWMLRLDLAWEAALRGDTDESERLATEALNVGIESGQPDAGLLFGLQLLMIHYQRGALAEAMVLMEGVATSTPRLAAMLGAPLAVAAVEAGRVEEARQRLQDFAADGFALDMNVGWGATMTLYADAAIELGDPAFAGPIFNQLAPWPEQWIFSGVAVHGVVCHFLGGLAAVMGRFDDADGYLAQAARQCETAGAEFFLTQTHLVWGRALSARGSVGDGAKARDLLERARHAAHERKYASVHRRADAALAMLDQ